MTKERFDELTTTLLAHKYLYYILIKPVITDYEYDMLEKEWVILGRKLDVIDFFESSPCIDFDENHPLAKEAIELSTELLKGKRHG